MTRRRHGAGDRPETGTRTRASGPGPGSPGEVSRRTWPGTTRRVRPYYGPIRQCNDLFDFLSCSTVLSDHIELWRHCAGCCPLRSVSAMDRCSAVRVEQFVERDAE
jgi:hypothetical protein